MTISASSDAKAIVSLVDALQTFITDRNRPLYDARDARSCVATFSRMVGRPADEIPLTAVELQGHFSSILPARFNVTPKRWSNIKSRVRAIARHAGVIDRKRAKREPLTPDWEALCDRLPLRPTRFVLSSFMTYCSRNDISPTEVSDATLTGFVTWREQRTSRATTPRERARIVNAWNRASANAPDWPRNTLSSMPRRPTVIEHLLRFPDSFRRELDEYLHHREAGAKDPFALPYASRRLAAATIIHRRSLIVRVANATVEAGASPNTIASLADIVAPANLRLALSQIYKKAGNRWPVSVEQLWSHMFSIARDLDCPVEQIMELQKLRKRSTPDKKHGLSAWVMTRLVALEQPAIRDALMLLPSRLEEAAKRHRAKRPRHAVHLHEAAVLYLMLLHNPLRRRNVAQLDLGKHFKWDRAGNPISMHFRADETKNALPIDWEMPQDVICLLRRHLAEYRPLLRTAQGNARLFPGENGKGRDPVSLSRMMRVCGEKYLGVPVHMHLMRHFVATMLYAADPRNGVVVQRLLLHTQVKTTERMYGAPRSSGALAEHAALLNSHMAAAKARRATTKNVRKAETRKIAKKGDR